MSGREQGRELVRISKGSRGRILEDHSVRIRSRCMINICLRITAPFYWNRIRRTSGRELVRIPRMNSPSNPAATSAKVHLESRDNETPGVRRAGLVQQFHQTQSKLPAIGRMMADSSVRVDYHHDDSHNTAHHFFLVLESNVRECPWE